MARRYYFLKLPDNFFSDKRIMKLRKIAGGDTYTLIYLKMLLTSLSDEGYIYIDGIEETAEQEISLIIGEDPDNISITLRYLENVGLCETNVDGVFFNALPAMIKSETDSARRVRAFRERQKLEAQKPEQLESGIDFETVVNAYNEICVTLPKVTKLTDVRKRAIRTRITEYSQDDVIRAFRIINDDPFMSGRDGKWKRCNFDWILKKDNFLKIMEGKYSNDRGQEDEYSV